MGAANLTAFFKLTIPARILVFLGFTAFVMLDYGSPILIGIGAIDLAGAAWTYLALKKENQFPK